MKLGASESFLCCEHVTGILGNFVGAFHVPSCAGGLLYPEAFHQQDEYVWAPISTPASQGNARGVVKLS